MPTLEEIQQPIAGEIRHYEAYIASILHSDNAFVSSICNYILSNRGKQIRPLLVMLSAALHDKVEQRTYIGAAVVEMIHAASLIHDDVVDEAYVRRGAPSVNALWRSHTAVLVGDYIFARTYHNCIEQKGEDMLVEVTRAVHEVSEGELIQTDRSENLDMTREVYFDIIYKKTASLIGACGAIGAISVHAAPEKVVRIRSFADKLGMAFQVKDDILDYSPMEITGKPSGGDLRERKITLPLLYLLENSSRKERTQLIDKLSNIRQRPKNAEYIQQAVLTGGGIEHAEACMKELCDEALAYLAPYPDSVAKQSLEQFAAYVLWRKK